MDRSERAGILLLVLSAAAWSLAGIFTRAIAADAWTIIFWRAAFSFLFIAAYVVARSGWDMFRSFGRPHAPTLAIAAVSSIGTAFFIPAFKHTAIANVALIYATVPLMTAPLARLWLGERMNRATLLAAAACLMGMLVIVGGSLGSPHLFGDGLALAMTAAMAVMLRSIADTRSEGNDGQPRVISHADGRGLACSFPSGPCRPGRSASGGFRARLRLCLHNAG